MEKYSIVIFLLLFFCCFVFGGVYDYPVKLESVVSQIPTMTNVDCKFKQEKYFKNISKPVISGGDFKFVKNKGVYFNTTYPIKSSVDYTNQNYRQINDVIKALTLKKYSKLEKEFKFYMTKNSSSWVLGMKPKEKSDVYKYLSKITIEGDSYIHRIDIVQTNGNMTRIWFIK